MKVKPFGLLQVLMFVVCLWPQHGWAQGYDATAYQGSSPKGTYDVKVTEHGGWSEKTSWWEMNVLRNGKPILSDYYLSPFYAWTCIDRGKAIWMSDSVLQFRNLSAQGRFVEVTFQNQSDVDVGFAEVWLRSMGSKGYPHSPSMSLLFDIHQKATHHLLSEIFPGAEYFTVRSECQGKIVIKQFRVPSKRGWPHDIDLDDRNKMIKIRFSSTDLVIDGGAFEELTELEIKKLVPAGERLHLAEEKHDHRKKEHKHNQPDADDGK